ncbi:hypothetical protein CLSA_c16020 [Clostridium saccharobutylicum DSM 13864]|uniref:Uncharacterized protein n=1 Tax=Clostridium saccharobutylicum DSM 13864 TaxID=1345695 RepID=U5MSH0_CLOSA|nr:hypothetical protein CLSA_c16020 [Clostridium saccharobutylicum DSM 13864]
MGTGTISLKKVICNLTEAFEKTNFQIYISTEQVRQYNNYNWTHTI